MWYLKVSSSLLIAVALICMIQNAISLTIDPKATEDQWSTLASSTDQNDLKKISKLCQVSLNNFKEKLENTKTIANKKLPEPNKTTEDIANLVSDIKNQVKNASADLVSVRKLVQKTALRFRDTFKSLVSFTELDSESVNKELESIKKTTVDSKKPLVNRIIQSFGNRYDLNKLANKVLEVSSDREKLKNNYNEKKKIAKKEFNSLWNSLSNHSKTVNDNALKALDTFFEGMKSVKSVKKKVKALGEDALDEIKVGDDIIKLKNAVELAKSLKLKFEDEWNLDSGELTYSEEQKKPITKTTDDDQSDVQNKEKDESNENISTNDLEPVLPTTEQEPIENDKTNVIPPTQAEIEKNPILDNRQTSDKAVSQTEETQLPLDRKSKDVTKIIQPTISETEHNPIKNNDQNSIDNNDSKSDSSIKQTSFNPDINNNKVLNTPLNESTDNKRGKRINKITSREKSLILPWEKLIQQDNPRVSQQSMKCENLLNNVTPDFDNIKKSAKNLIQVTKNYKNLQNIENETVKQFYDKMVDTNTKLCDYLVNAADDVCAKVTPINKRYETKFKNDPNIKRIKYLLGKQYDPNQYILKVLDDANHKNGIGGMKKTTYYKMLAVAHNLNHETKEMENAALYAMNKIHEGKLAATNIQKKLNKEKASKACYIKNILLEKENEDDKKNKEENKEKVKESINEDTDTEPLNPDVNLDSVDAIQPSTVTDDNEPIINNGEDTKTFSEPNEFTSFNNQKENADKTNIEDSKSAKGNIEQGDQEPNSSSSIPENKDNDINTGIEQYGNNKAKHNISRKITHHRKHRNPNDPNDVSEEYDSIEEIDDEEDESNESKNNLEKINNEIGKENANITSRPKISEKIETLEQEDRNNLNESGERNNKNDKGINMSAKPKVKRYRKRIDPKDGKEITEEYESWEEEDDINSNKSGEKTSNEDPESVILDNADNEHDTKTIEPLETEEVASDKENGEGINTSAKPKVKHYRKRIDPNDGKEITEEYESWEEEDDINSNKSGEKKSNEAPESGILDNADNEHDTKTPEPLETEEVASDEENDEGLKTSAKPKVKHYRKRIDPNDGKEITEEYESWEEEDDITSNKSGEKTSNEAPESGILDNADNEHDTKTIEPLETEEVASDKENGEGINTSAKPKVKHYRKRIDPNDGKEITEEYESWEEEDDINSNKSGEKKSNEAPESGILDNADNEHDTNTPEPLETEDVASDEENDEGLKTSSKPKVKRYRKRIDPKDGKEITEEYESSEEEDVVTSNKSGEKTSNEAPESEILDNADNEHDTETPEHLETEKVASDEGNDEELKTSAKPKVKHYRKRIDPNDGNEITEEYESWEKEDDINSNKSGETTSNDAPESEILDNADNEHDTKSPEPLETEVASDEENDKGINTSAKPKMKHYRKRIDPNDGKEITEEYESTEEENDVTSNKSGEKTSNEALESGILDTADNEHDTKTPEPLETEKVASDEENDEGLKTSSKPKVKRYRKRIDPKDGKEITEEYESSEEEDDINSNKSGEQTSNEAPESEISDTADNEHDTKTLEPLETEKVASDEENDEGLKTSSKAKVKRYRKRIDPKDGKEITEEYESSEEEDDINSNKSGEKTSNEAPESEISDNADNEYDTETPEPLETEEVASDEENDKGINTSAKPKMKHYRKRIDPNDGKEITEEYESWEKEDDINSNNSGEKTSNDAPESEILDNADNKHDTETPEHLENEKFASDEENDEKLTTSAKPKMKHYRKRIDPKDGKEITEEYESWEEEDDITSNKSGEKTSNEAPESEILDNADNEHDTETPEPLETEEVASDEENDEGINTSAKPKMKHYRKRIDPKDGKEITEEYESSEEEDDIKSNESGEKISNEAPEFSEEENNEGINKIDLDPENITNETVQLDDNENLNSVEGAELNGVDNDNIVPAADSMGEDTSSVESSYEELEQSYIKDSNNSHKNINEQYNSDDLPNKKTRRHRKRKDPKNDLEVSDEYDADEEQEDYSPVVSKNNDTPSGPPDGESEEHYNTVHEPETPEYENVPENVEIPETDEILDHIQSNEHEETDENEPEIKSNDEINNTNDIDQQSDGQNPPNKKLRRRRKRKDHKYDQEVSEEYDIVEEQEEPTVLDENYNTLPGEPEYKTKHESDTPENDEIPEYNRSNEHAEISSNEEKDIPKEIAEQNNAGNQTDKKIKRHRKRKDPLHSHEISEEYETIEAEDDINKLETPDMVSFDQFDKNPINKNKPNNENNANSEKSLFNPPKYKPKRFRNQKNPEYDHEISKEYDSLEENDEEAKVNKHTFRDDINYENQDFNNNVISKIDNKVSENVLNTGHDEPTDVPQTIFEENNEIEPESSEYPENAAPETSSPNYVDEPINVANPRPRKLRRHRKSRHPKTVNENYNEPEVANDDNDVQEELPETGNYETTDIDDEIEQPELSEYPENSDAAPETSSPNYVDEPINVANPRPRKLRRHRKSRHPKTVNENYNEPEVANDDNDVQEELPETENYETTDIDDEIEQPELSEYPENSDAAPETSSPNYVDEPINVANPRPRKLRRHRKSRHPKTVNENYNEPEVANDDNDVQEELPDTENYETTDIDDEIEQPELSEYPENSDAAPETSSPNYVDEPINVANPRPRKLRRHRKSRHPKTVNENYNEPEVANDDNDVQEELPETGNYETTDIDDEIEQPELSEYPENSDAAPETSSPNYVDEPINVANPRPRKLRRHRKSRHPKTVNENYNEPEVANDDNDVQEELPETENYETTDIDDEIEQPELSEYPENSDAAPETSSPNYVDEPINVANPRPRKLRRHRKSRHPKTVNENYNEPEVANDDNDVQEELPETENYETTDIDDEIEQPELSEYPENSDAAPETSSPNYVDEPINVANPRPRKLRRHRKSRHPKTVNENYNEPEVANDDNDVQEELPETGNYETTDIDDEIEQPELSEYPENSDAAPETSSPNYVDEPINVANPRPRKLRRHRKSRHPKTVNENYNEPEVANDDNDVQEELPETENYETTDIDDEIEQPELSEYPENSDAAPETSSPNYVDEPINVANPRPRKLRRHRKSRHPKTVNENYNEPEVTNDDNDVQEELPETENYETTDIDDEIEQPELSEYPENSDAAPETSSPNYVDEPINVANPRPRKLRRHRKSRHPKTVNENYNEPEVANDDNDVQEELPETGNYETTDIDDEIEQPELSEYPENSDAAPETSSLNYVDEPINVANPRPRKLRRHRKSRHPKTVNENYNEPEVANDDNDVQEELPETENYETTDIDDEIEQPELSEYPENSDAAPETSSPNYVDEPINVANPRPRKLRRHRKSRHPKTVNENYNEPEVANDDNDVQEELPETGNYETTDIDDEIEQPELSEYPENSDAAPETSSPNYVDEPINVANPRSKTANLNDTDGTKNSKQPRRKKHVRRKKIPTTVEEITPNSLDTENRRTQKDDKSVDNPETLPNDIGRNPKKKRRLRRITTYMVNKATNERIPINDQTYSTTDGSPDTPKNKLEANEIGDSDDQDSNEDNDDYSSFLFKEYNSDQCKRDAYDRFKKVTSQDAKQIAYRSVLDTSEMRSNMLATIKNAIWNIKVSKTLNDVDQSLRTVSCSLKNGLKQTVGDLVTKVIPLAKDFLKTAENLKELYKNGPQSTHKMLSNVLENESTVPDSAKDVLKLISPQFDVDELINNIFEKPFNTKSLKEKKAKAQRKLIGLSKHMDTAISNIDCFVLSAMSAVGIGADTLKMLKSGRVIMSDKHPRAKALRDAVGIIKSGKKIRNNDVGFTPSLTPPDGFNESYEDDDDEDPDQVAQKNEEFLKTVPDLDDNIPVPKKLPNKQQSLGVIVVHPDKQIEYKEVTDTSQLKKFVEDQTKKYKLQSKNKHPKFLKLNSKKLVDSMVADVKKKAEINGMSKKEMIEEIIKNLNSS